MTTSSITLGESSYLHYFLERSCTLMRKNGIPFSLLIEQANRQREAEDLRTLRFRVSTLLPDGETQEKIARILSNGIEYLFQKKTSLPFDVRKKEIKQTYDLVGKELLKEKISLPLVENPKTADEKFFAFLENLKKKPLFIKKKPLFAIEEPQLSGDASSLISLTLKSRFTLIEGLLESAEPTLKDFDRTINRILSDTRFSLAQIEALAKIYENICGIPFETTFYRFFDDGHVREDQSLGVALSHHRFLTGEDRDRIQRSPAIYLKKRWGILYNERDVKTLADLLEKNRLASKLCAYIQPKKRERAFDGTLEDLLLMIKSIEVLESITRYPRFSWTLDHLLDFFTQEKFKPHVSSIYQHLSQHFKCKLQNDAIHLYFLTKVGEKSPLFREVARTIFSFPIPGRYYPLSREAPPDETLKFRHLDDFAQQAPPSLKAPLQHEFSKLYFEEKSYLKSFLIYPFSFPVLSFFPRFFQGLLGLLFGYRFPL